MRMTLRFWYVSLAAARLWMVGWMLAGWAHGARAASEPGVIPLWPAGAPGFEARKDEPEKIMNNRQTNIHFPTLTAFLPDAAKATGLAVVIAPGGGHAHLADEHEGYAVARWLAERGIAGFVLKYRLAKDRAQDGKSPYTVEEHALADARRALRLVRSRAAEWKLEANAIGLMGFSAGGELALLATTRAEAGRADDGDAVERQSSRPSFVALMYPGRVTRSDAVLTKEAPPVFVAAGSNDTFVEPITQFYLAARKAGVSVELHLYAGIGHGFGIRAEDPPAVKAWPEQFRVWLLDRKLTGAGGR